MEYTYVSQRSENPYVLQGDIEQAKSLLLEIKELLRSLLESDFDFEKVLQEPNVKKYSHALLVDSVKQFLSSVYVEKKLGVAAAIVDEEIEMPRKFKELLEYYEICLLYTSPSPRDYAASRMPSSA